MDVVQILLSLVLGYACGSIPSGYLAGRARGIDIRQHGSGNIGFTNVYRTLGPAWAAPVLIIDVAKGMIPTALAAGIGLVPALVGLGSILGHVFTPWLRFQGGKGVATTIGVTAFLCFRSLAAGLGLYALALLATGYISIASILFGLALAPMTILFYPGDPTRLVYAAAVGLLILVRHTTNIRRLVHGNEPRFKPWLKLFRRQT
jgi:glycerol-3-phosphate acyltransferase PlsY